MSIGVNRCTVLEALFWKPCFKSADQGTINQIQGSREQQREENNSSVPSIHGVIGELCPKAEQHPFTA
jgi:hypothetical protein